MLEAFTALLKLALYAGLLSSSGAVFAQATLHPLPEELGHLTQLSRGGSTLVLVTVPLLALLLILRLGGAFDAATLSAVFLSSSGAALCLQVTGAFLLLISTVDDDAVVRLSYAMLPMLAFAFSGHTAAIGPLEGLVAVAHVSVAAWWLGSLYFLRRACALARAERVVTAVARFSSLAFILTAVLVVAGLVLVMILVDFSLDPWSSPYGWILATKLCVVAVLLAVAGYNRRRLTPRLLAGDGAAVGALRRTIGIELALIALILTITAILTTYTAPPD
jgi:putative copper export protein